MKITKPKENQLLFEDDVFKDFKLECEHKNIIEGSKFDNTYNGIVLGYRFTPMGSSKQMFYGSNISILTLLSSMLENLLTHEVLTEKQLYRMVDMIIEHVKERG